VSVNPEEDTVRKIEYKVTFSEGDTRIFEVKARGINSGAGKALEQALRYAKRQRLEFHSIEFWQVKDF
jgi:hypothetical protein